ncbi:MAG TPA: glycosyltransferase family 2 protein [Ignavibacteriaceae bacterium]|jgi:rhamnosyltransferase|nr:glycosyltransferase family 2 protein [Ignavibacteriaceae bacterium]
MPVKKSEIAGIVVLYNPDNEVIKNILSYSSQVNKLYVYDNSDTLNSKLIEKIRAINNIIYITENSNKGIGYALNIGASKAKMEGYKYVLTMDQDSSTSPNYVEELLSAFIEIQNTGLATPFYQNKYGTKKSGIEKYLQITTAMTSGNLLSLDAYDKTGNFKDEYFIDYIDIEYCLRLKKVGYKVIQVNTALLNHNEANISEKHFIIRKVYPYNNSPLRFYYKTRNYKYLCLEYSNNFPYEIHRERLFFIKNVIKMLLFEEKKGEKIKMMLRGLKDYQKRKTGKLQI